MDQQTAKIYRQAPQRWHEKYTKCYFLKKQLLYSLVGPSHSHSIPQSGMLPFYLFSLKVSYKVQLYRKSNKNTFPSRETVQKYRQYKNCNFLLITPIFCYKLNA